jgi:hypothetical protein
VLDKEAAELRDEVAALQQRLAAFDEAAVRDFAAKVGDSWYFASLFRASRICTISAPCFRRNLHHSSQLFICNRTCGTHHQAKVLALSQHTCHNMLVASTVLLICLHLMLPLPLLPALLLLPLLLRQAESYKADLQRANSELTSLLRDKSKVRWVWHAWHLQGGLRAAA